MRRLLTLLLCLTMLIPTLPAMAEEEPQRLIIAVDSEESALNLSIEEAFFKENPNTVIEYRLYSANQLNSLLMTNQVDFDMVILDYATLLDMVEKDYLLTLDQIGLEGYPSGMVDVSNLLMYDGKLFALPISINQTAWFIHYEMSEQNGIEYPAHDGVWTWDEYLEFSKQFPIQYGERDPKHLYMMTGDSIADYASLQNVQVDMLLNYLELYPNKIERFFTDYFSIFKQVIKSSALMPAKMDESKQERKNRTNDVLIIQTGAGNPIWLMKSFDLRSSWLYTLEMLRDPNITVEGVTEEEVIETLPTLDSWQLLPKPVFEKDDVRYLGGMRACGIMKNAENIELATKFIKAMVSQEALDVGVLMNESAFIAKDCPNKMIVNPYAYYPIFVDENGNQIYAVQTGREFIYEPFSQYYKESYYQEAQEYRSHLAVTRFHAQRDFYNAVWSYLQEWYLGHISDAELQESVTYLVEMALEE